MTRLLAVLAFLLLLAPVSAREEAVSYDVSVVVAADGSAEVTETMTVNVEGKEIKRGLYQTLPRTLIGDDGSMLQPTIDVLSVTRDGEPLPYLIEDSATHVIIRMGDPNVFLEHRIHTFVLRYRYSELAKPFDGKNNISFEPIGKWTFPIIESSFRVTLPPGSTLTKTFARIGTEMGDEAGDWEQIARNKAAFVSKWPVGGLHSLNVTVTFEGGLTPREVALEPKKELTQ